MAQDYYKVAIKVVSQQGHCAAGHKVGDQWTSNGLTPEGICMSAFSCLSPSIRVLRYGGMLPWEPDKDVTTIACTDPTNPVVFELKRLHKSK